MLYLLTLHPLPHALLGCGPMSPAVGEWARCVLGMGLRTLQCERYDGCSPHASTPHPAGTGLYELWKRGAYTNYHPDRLVDLVARVLALVRGHAALHLTCTPTPHMQPHTSHPSHKHCRGHICRHLEWANVWFARVVHQYVLGLGWRASRGICTCPH